MCRIPLIVLAVALFVLFAMPRPVAAIVLSEGPAGSGTTGSWDGVGIIGNQYQPDGAGAGTLIDPLHVLTVAHIVAGTLTADLTFEVDGNTYHAASVAIPSQYTGMGSVATADAYDIAVITLTAPVTGSTIWNYNSGSFTASGRMASIATMVGYGYGGTGTGGADPTDYPFGTKRAANNAIDLVTTSPTVISDALGHDDTTIPAGLDVWDFDDASNPSSDGPLGGPAVSGEGDSTDGDSGGPIFQFDSALDQYVLTGMIEDGTDPGTGSDGVGSSQIGEIGWATDTAYYASFIAGAVPEPVSLTPLLLGAAMLVRRRRTR